MPTDHDAAWLDKLHDEFVEAFKSNDQKALGGFYTDDAVLLPPGRPLVSGRAAILEFWQSSERIQDLVFEATAVKMVGNGTMREAGNLLVTSRGQGRELRNTESKYVTVWVQVDGAWKIDSNGWNGATARRGGRRGNRGGGGRRGEGEGRGRQGGGGRQGAGGRRRAGGGRRGAGED